MKNLIIPLIDQQGHFVLLPQQLYYLEGSCFGYAADETVTNIEVTKVDVSSKKIIVLWNGKRKAIAPKNIVQDSKDVLETDIGPTTNYATEIDLTRHVALQERRNRKLFPENTDCMPSFCRGQTKKHIPKPAKH